MKQEVLSRAVKTLEGERLECEQLLLWAPVAQLKGFNSFVLR